MRMHDLILPILTATCAGTAVVPALSHESGQADRLVSCTAAPCVSALRPIAPPVEALRGPAPALRAMHSLMQEDAAATTSPSPSKSMADSGRPDSIEIQRGDRVIGWVVPDEAQVRRAFQDRVTDLSNRPADDGSWRGPRLVYSNPPRNATRPLTRVEERRQQRSEDGVLRLKGERFHRQFDFITDLARERQERRRERRRDGHGGLR